MALIDRIRRTGRFLYLKLFRINDTPLKIALGFGLGVFLGVMPGVGPVVALLLAFIFRINRASALLGSLLFNTWSGIISLLLAIEIIAQTKQAKNSTGDNRSHPQDGKGESIVGSRANTW